MKSAPPLLDTTLVIVQRVRKIDHGSDGCYGSKTDSFSKISENQFHPFNLCSILPLAERVLAFPAVGQPDYIMPPMPPMPMSPPPGMGASGAGMSVIRAEVVRIMAAIEVAFSTALRVTLAGSMMPASSMST